MVTGTICCPAEDRRAIDPDTCFPLRGNGRSPKIAVVIYRRKKGK
jgi:hypothetical protein